MIHFGSFLHTLHHWSMVDLAWYHWLREKPRFKIRTFEIDDEIKLQFSHLTILENQIEAYI